jgi:hypothetical protein
LFVLPTRVLPSLRRVATRLDLRFSARRSHRRYAALALVPPLGLVSPPVPLVPVLVSVEGLVSVLVFGALSPLSVFSADFVALASGFDSVDEGFFEP